MEQQKASGFQNTYDSSLVDFRVDGSLAAVGVTNTGGGGAGERLGPFCGPRLVLMSAESGRRDSTHIYLSFIFRHTF